MNALALTSTIGIVALLDFLLLLATFSLRGFSRSRLDEICLAKGRRDRFGDILRWDEDALLVCELLSVLFTAALVGLVIDAFNFTALPPAGLVAWIAYLAGAIGVGVLFLFGVVVLPWTISRVAGEHFLFRTWPLLRLLQRMFRPVSVALRKLDDLVHRLTGVQRPENGELASITEEIRTVVDEGEREGLLENEARTMIHRVMEMREVDTAAIMTPRTEMVCIRVDATLDEARTLMLEAGHSRVPVIGETTDDIRGILYAKDLLKHVHAENGQNTNLEEFAREPFYVPETTAIDNLLEAMKRKRVHVAIVVDEYGGVAGLVSMEDILEEIVGEIVDEYDAAEETGIVAVSPDVLEVQSRVHIDDLNEQFQLELPEDSDYDTIGGFVVHHLGRIPESGETFTWGQLRFTVKAADSRRIHKVRLERDRTLAAAVEET